VCILASRTQQPEVAWIGITFFFIGAILAYLPVRSFTRASFFNARTRPRAIRRSGDSAIATRSDAVAFEVMRALQILRTQSRRYGHQRLRRDQLNVALHDGKRSAPR
jgi:hypothetical protein